jgi:hypothetical protein
MRKKEDAEDQEANAARSKARAQEGAEPAPGEVGAADRGSKSHQRAFLSQREAV